MRIVAHVVAMHIINVVPAEVESTDGPAQELYPNEQAQIAMDFTDEEVFVKGHNYEIRLGNDAAVTAHNCRGILRVMREFVGGVHGIFRRLNIKQNHTYNGGCFRSFYWPDKLNANSKISRSRSV